MTFEHLWLPVLACRRFNLSAGFHMHAISTELEIYVVLATKTFPLWLASLLVWLKLACVHLWYKHIPFLLFLKSLFEMCVRAPFFDIEDGSLIKICDVYLMCVTVF